MTEAMSSHQPRPLAQKLCYRWMIVKVTIRISTAPKQSNQVT